MKKNFLLLALTLLCSAFWSSARGEDTTEWTYDPDEPLITEVSQMSDNCAWSAGANSACFFNDNPNDCFHSNPSFDLHTQDEWIQVDLSYAIQNMYFKMVRRRDGSGTYYNGWNQLPNNVDILVSEDGETWTTAVNVSHPELDNTSEKDFADYVDLGKEYFHVRFLVKGTVDDNNWFNIQQMQMYRAVKASEQTKLNTLLFNLKNSSTTYLPGTNPGFCGETEYDDMTKAFETAAIYVKEEHTDAEYKEMSETIQKAYDACVASKIEIHDGYYYLKSAYPAFKDVQPDITKAIYTDLDNELSWGNFDENLPKYIFHITKQEDGYYAIQGIQNKLYVESAGAAVEVDASQPVIMNEKYTRGQFFIELGYGEFKICNTLNVHSYNAYGSNSGAGASGKVCTAYAGENSEVAWYLSEITDQAKIDEMIASAEKHFNADNLQSAVNKAVTARKKANDYKALVTDPAQFSSNAKEPNEGSYANLLDGNVSTLFHTLYSTATSYAHNLQVDLGTAKQQVHYWLKARTGNYHDTPNNMQIYITNVDTLGTDAYSSNDLWKNAGTVKDSTIANVAEAEYTSPDLDFGEPYRYLRIVVNGTTSSRKTLGNLFFNISEFQVYDGVPTETSEYYTVSGMKEACDALSASITEAKEKIASLTATQADIDAISSLTDAVNNLYVDRDALDTEMANMIDSAKTVHAKAISTTTALITNVNQLSANSIQVADGGGLAALIDNNTATYCHSAYSTNNGSTLPDADHYLQIDLTSSTVPVDSFCIDFTGRVGTSHDTPDSVDIYVTNDASLLEGDSEAWTLVKSLGDMIEGSPNEAKFKSDMIHLDGTYNYVRMVIRKTSAERQEDTFHRYFWNLSEFQLYAALPSDRVQYNYVEGMKDAADNLQTAIETASKYGKHELYTDEPIQTLRTATNNVLALYADSTLLVEAYDKYILRADSSSVGEGIGFVDAQEAIDAFRTAINTAKASVSATQPTAAGIKTAISDMSTAYTTFLTHVTPITPNQWYNIVSGSTRPAFTNQPIFLVSTSTGAKLKISNYPTDTTDPKSDPYAIFRFVPVEGQEGQFFVQSLGTGQYFGAYRGEGSDLSPLMSHEKAAYKVMYFGNGKFKLIQANVKDEMDALKTDGTNGVVLNWPSNGDNQQTWKFNAINSDQELRFGYMPDNSITVMTLPFASKGDLSLMSINAGTVNTYAIQSMNVTEEGTELNLKIKEEFEAGEPFIITINDYTQFDANAPVCPISLAVPESVVDTSSIVANGLIGTLQGMNIDKAGMGIFTNSTLTATGKDVVFIASRNGYINPTKVTNEEGTPDLIITVGDIINSAKPGAVITTAEKANLYTSDGVLIKKDVKGTQVPNNLQKGVYILGKKKIAVK